MINKLNILQALFVLATFASVQVRADEALVTHQFSEILQKVKEKSAEHGAEKVLVVIDIDNTLLALNQNFGSDQWMDWQSSLLKQGSADLVASDFEGLLLVQQKLFSLSGMHLTDPAIPQVLAELKRMNIEIIILTARGTEMLSSTIREFQRNGLDFFPKQGYESKVYVPYDLKNPQASCLNERDISETKSTPPRLMNITNKVIHSSGQHKGVILKTVLCQMKKEYKSIVFIDDKQKNVDHMTATFQPLVDLVTYRFTSEDGKVEAFHQSDKSEVIRDWNQLRDSLQLIFK